MSEEKNKAPNLFVDYHQLLEATSDIIFAIDADEKISYINSAWKILYPSKKDKVIGLSYLELISTYEQERAEYVFESVVKKGIVIKDELLKTYSEDGTVFYFLISFSPIKQEEKIIGGIGVMKDISNTILAQKKLKANAKILEEKVKEQIHQTDELKLLSAFNEEVIANAPFGIMVLDSSGIILSENPAAMKIMKREPSDSLVGTNLLTKEVFIEAGFADKFEEILRSKKTMVVHNAPYHPLKGEEEIIIDFTVHPLFDKNSLLEKVLVIITDNTEKSKLTEKINRAEKLFSLGALASGIAYELRLPIDVMGMDLIFVSNNIKENSPASDYVDSLKKELQRIKNFSDQLLALAGTIEDNDQTCDFNKIFSDYPLDVLIDRLKEAGFKIILQLPEKSPVIKVAPARIIRILVDLIENAEEAMPEKKGEIKILADLVKLEEGIFLSISLDDSGIGIPEDKMEHIFEPFFTTKGKEATGLGLMITSVVIENLGGSIGIKSKVGEGTSVRVLLPIIEE